MFKRILLSLLVPLALCGACGDDEDAGAANCTTPGNECPSGLECVYYGTAWTCLPPGPDPVCGNGRVEGDEGCDERQETATCDDDCTVAECGDGTLNLTAEEACDDGGESATCDSDCTVAECGDGTTNGAASEECDDAGASESCDADCTLAVCGDGTLNALALEECDDGGETETCDTDCTPVACGDGTTNVAAAEECDDAGPSETCDGDCTLAVCGDGTVNTLALEVCDESGETETCDDDCTLVECGDGNHNETAEEECDDAGDSETCDADCTLAVCGDLTVNPAAFEDCDEDGETATCDADCTLVECGDGYLNATALEACDDGGESAICDDDCTPAECGDGNTNAAASEQCDDIGESETCNVDCTLAECGDGYVNVLASEECDDEGESETCDPDCTLAECGDGYVNSVLGETCDPGGETSTCDVDCTLVVCGDGVVNESASEECDDGGTDDNDGCSSNCQIESDWLCSPDGPSVCQTCGNGVIEGIEDCDGNSVVNGQCVDCVAVCPPDLGVCPDDLAAGCVCPLADLTWLAQASGPGFATSKDVAVAPNDGSVYFGGVYRLEDGEELTIGDTTLITGERDTFDGFLAKVDRNGTHLWAMGITGILNEAVIGVETIPTLRGHDVLIAGYFCSHDLIHPDVCAVNLGGTVIDATDDADVFLARLSSEGELVWYTTIGGDGAQTIGSLGMLQDGRAVLSGGYCNNNSADCTSTIGLGAGAMEIGISHAPAGYLAHTYLAAFDTDGTPTWVRQLSSPTNHSAEALGVGVDGDGNEWINLSGRVYAAAGAAVFTPNANPYVDADGIYVARYDTEGLLQWAGMIAENVTVSAENTPQAAAVLSDGGLVVTGLFRGTLDWPDGPRTHSCTGSSCGRQTDVFLTKLSSTGFHEFTYQYATTGDHKETGLMAAPGSTFFLTGDVPGPGIDFGGAAPVSKTDAGGAYLARYTDDGGLQWIRGFVADGHAIGTSMARTHDGNLIVAGGLTLGGTMYLDGNPTSHDTIGLSSGFAAKFRILPPIRDPLIPSQN